MDCFRLHYRRIFSEALCAERISAARNNFEGGVKDDRHSFVDFGQRLNRGNRFYYVAGDVANDATHGWATGDRFASRSC